MNEEGPVQNACERFYLLSDNDKEHQRWQVFRDALRAYHHPKNFGRCSRPIEDFPGEIASAIGDEIELLLTSKFILDRFEELRSGDRYKSPGERRDRLCTVRYVVAAEQGLIDDSTPRKTILSWFEMADLRTVHLWLSKFRSEVNLDEFQPEKSNEFRAGAITELAKAAAQDWKARWPGNEPQHAPINHALANQL